MRGIKSATLRKFQTSPLGAVFCLFYVFICTGISAGRSTTPPQAPPQLLLLYGEGYLSPESLFYCFGYLFHGCHMFFTMLSVFASKQKLLRAW